MFGNILLFSVTASFWCLVSHNYTKKYCVATNIGMQVSELHRWAPSHNYVGVQCHRITPRCGVSQICTGVACPKNDTKMWCHRRALVYSVSELHSVLCYRIILVFCVTTVCCVTDLQWCSFFWNHIGVLCERKIELGITLRYIVLDLRWFAKSELRWCTFVHTYICGLCHRIVPAPISPNYAGVLCHRHYIDL